MQNNQPLYTTLNKIREHRPCKSGWEKLLAHLGKTQADDEPLPFHTIFESNGFDDAIWCIRAAPEYRKEWDQFLVVCLKSVQHLMKDERSKAVIKALENDSITAQIKHDASAAYAAAKAAYAAAASAAYAADAAAYAAYAADAAAYAASAAKFQEREKQAQFFLSIVS